jgi:hypothetical protein
MSKTRNASTCTNPNDYVRPMGLCGAPCADVAWEIRRLIATGASATEQALWLASARSMTCFS